MSVEAQLLYLEPDDEITTVVRRLREADAPRVVLVASGRSKATTGAIALRLLAGVAADEGREVALVADAAGRALAAEAGIPAFASVADASAQDAVPLDPVPPRRAPIHVVRGASEPVAPPPPTEPPHRPARAASATSASDDTQAVALPPVPSGRLAAAGRRRALPRAALGTLIALLLLSVAGLAAVAPAATVRLVPASVAVGPSAYELRFEEPEVRAGTVTATQRGEASGSYRDLEPAAGTVTFYNWNTSTAVSVPAGTGVAADDVSFTTAETVQVPRATLIRFNPLTVRAGQASVGAVAVSPGPAGNVGPEAIDTVTDEGTAAELRGLPDNPERLVINVEAMSGGVDAAGPVISQADVDRAVADLTDALRAAAARELGDDEDVVVVDPAEPPQPIIAGLEGLVGTRDMPSFELSGELAFDRLLVPRGEVETAAIGVALEDEGLAAAGFQLEESSLDVTVEPARRDDEQLVVPITVRGVAVARIDPDAIRAQVAGLTPEEAEAVLADIGRAEVELWPGWVDRVPALSWRVSLEITGE